MNITEIENIVRKTANEYANTGEVKIGVSQRHIHLSREHLDILFGKGYELTKKKTLMGREYAAEECVTLVGPSLKAIEKVRVLGPVRKDTQIEISRTDTFILKVSPPVRPSGDIKGSERMVIVGPKGSVYLNIFLCLGRMEHSVYPKVWCGVEGHNLPLPLYNEPYRYRLYPSCREFWGNLFPKDR